MKHFRLVASALTVLFLAACASSGAYKAADGSKYGYTDQRVETGRYRVTYTARSAEVAENGALRRAAEITLRDNYSYFTVVSRDLDRRRTGGGSSVGIGGSTGSRRTGVGVGINVPLGGGGEDVTVRMEISLGKGDKPQGPQSYDARSVLDNLRG
ncbi:hypothetical protein HK107_04685 [Parvularcula sp. ZS-1/3]|uniref:Lipoprotein n=1 Tax=Parvularcula mediterranea TaxID=2732508 RepID=A0A7Y3RLM2_9PROT|nr:hypothetical protein [Parvularcula mediterranea]NNU15612.1 hypothetical protein [Parvularcula mediterranea]